MTRASSTNIALIACPRPQEKTWEKEKQNITKQRGMLVIGAPVERAFVSVHPNHLRFRVPGEETPLGPTNSSFANHLTQYKHFVPLALIWYYNFFCGLWPFHFFYFFWLLYFCWAFFFFFLFFFLNNTYLSSAFAPLHKRERKRKVLTHYKTPIKE